MEPKRSTYFSNGTEYLKASEQTQAIRDEYVEVGVSHSSDEASNDRGAKGWQIDRA